MERELTSELVGDGARDDAFGGRRRLVACCHWPWSAVAVVWRVACVGAVEVIIFVSACIFPSADFFVWGVLSCSFLCPLVASSLLMTLAASNFVQARLWCSG